VTPPAFRRLVVVGVGLLGGSLALAARQRGVAACVVGAGRRRESLERALARGVVDEIADGPAAARDADAVVLATPIFAMAERLRDLAPGLRPGTLVTDVGSVKALLVETLPGLLPPGVHYVGAHPMAGSHRRGVEHARADLFEGAACVLTPVAGTDPDALRRARALWEAVGCRVVLRDPGRHDDEVAWMSHVPHALAFAFARAIEAAPSEAGEVAGSGFRDFTRIARSEPELWSEILAGNRKAIAGPLEDVARRLGEFARALEAGDLDRIDRFIAAGRDALGRLEAAGFGPGASHPARSGGENPEIQAAGGGPERSSKRNP
jgi:prephenate dehydrogenase